MSKFIEIVILHHPFLLQLVLALLWASLFQLLHETTLYGQESLMSVQYMNAQKVHICVYIFKEFTFYIF